MAFFPYMDPLVDNTEYSDIAWIIDHTRPRFCTGHFLVHSMLNSGPLVLVSGALDCPIHTIDTEIRAVLSIETLGLR